MNKKYLNDLYFTNNFVWNFNRKLIKLHEKVSALQRHNL